MMDYESIAAARLTSVFKDKPRIREVVVALPRQLSIFEQVADQVKNERGLDVAVGVQLDRLGEIIGEKRLGRTDEDYRRVLQFRIFVNISKGRPSDVNYVVKFLSQGDDVQYLESYPASVYMFTSGYEANATISTSAQEVSPAAIANIPVAVSFGDKPLRVSGIGHGDEDAELSGLQLGVFSSFTGDRLVTLGGKRIRVRFGHSYVYNGQHMAGVYQE